MTISGKEYNAAVETRAASGGPGGGGSNVRLNVRTWARRLDSSHLLVAVVASILVYLMNIPRPGGLVAFEQEWSGRRAQIAHFSRKVAGTVEEQRRHALEEATDSQQQPFLQHPANDVWEKAPRVDLVLRTYSDGLRIFWSVFFPTYLTFWPIDSWTTSGLVVVVDGESAEDHRIGTLLNNFKLMTKIQVKYEARPPDETTCSGWKREGYSRQQYSNFYADLYTDAEFVAIVDSDAGFTTPVVPSDLFEDGKPIVVGLNTGSIYYSKIGNKAVGGGNGVGSFMTKYAFPAIFKSAHLAQMRADMASNLEVATFEEAFHLICAAGRYSQLDLMYYYMWYNKNDEYSWHLANATNGHFRDYKGPRGKVFTDEVSVSEKNVPAPIVMFHYSYGKYSSSVGPHDLYDNLCNGSENVAGNCEAEAQKKPMKGSEGQFVTAMWDSPNHSWEQTYRSHMRSVSAAASAFVWHRETDTDRIYPGH